MERVAVFVGSPYNILSKRRFPKLIERKFNSKLRKISKYHYDLKTSERLIQFYGCYKPRKDKNYYSTKKYFKDERGESVPPPVKEVIKKVANPDRVFIVGTCGALKGERNEVFIPNNFYEKYFRNPITIKDIYRTQLKNPIKCKNLFSKIIKGTEGGLLTSNLTLIPENTEGNSKNNLTLLGGQLSPFVNCVDMESYPIINKFSKKPKGVLLYSSDVIGKSSKMNFNLARFQKVMCDSLYKIINK